jgi:hypothetical protein
MSSKARKEDLTVRQEEDLLQHKMAVERLKECGEKLPPPSRTPEGKRAIYFYKPPTQLEGFALGRQPRGKNKF